MDVQDNMCASEPWHERGDDQEVWRRVYLDDVITGTPDELPRRKRGKTRVLAQNADDAGTTPVLNRQAPNAYALDVLFGRLARSTRRKHVDAPACLASRESFTHDTRLADRIRTMDDHAQPTLSPPTILRGPQA